VVVLVLRTHLRTLTQRFSAFPAFVVTAYLLKQQRPPHSSLILHWPAAIEQALEKYMHGDGGGLIVLPASNNPLSDCWRYAAEQLTGTANDLTILTCAWSKDSKQNEPLDWVWQYNKGRVYTTMLGHTWKNEPNTNYKGNGRPAGV
jgi:type 1 glutamine amidotransferase